MDTTTWCIVDESTSHSTTAKTTTVSQPIATEKLCRVGSGASVVLDLDSGSGGEVESRKLPSSQYKGVVPQPNGRWGAQIYEKHQRVWLGTFNEEDEAGKAYDIAAQRFRGRDAITNFKSALGKQDDDDDQVESAFLSSHSKAEIVDMLRKHTYQDELQQSRRYYANTKEKEEEESRTRNNPHKSCEHLFDKAVTPSDVGKLNRLVIPKQHAEKHFPLQFGASCKGVLLNFEENGICGGKVWRFRYSYWNSSQSYVLTKGWSRFVKEKNLIAGDTVSFLRSTGGEDKKKLYIAWKAKPSSNTTTSTTAAELCFPIYPIDSANKLVQSSVQVVRLFGVNILTKLPTSTVDCGSNWNNGGKRNRQVLLSVECCKKPCLAPAL